MGGLFPMGSYNLFSDDYNSSYLMQPVANVVIVGASFGGRMVAKQLLEQNGSLFKITLIDKSPYFEFLCSSYKTLTDEDACEYLSVSNRRAVESLNRHYSEYPFKQKHQVTFKQGLLTKIDEKNNKITVVDIPSEDDGCD